MISGKQRFSENYGEVADYGVGGVYVDFELLACRDFANRVHGGFVASVNAEHLHIIVYDGAKVAWVNVNAQCVLLQVDAWQIVLCEHAAFNHFVELFIEVLW